MSLFRKHPAVTKPNPVPAQHSAEKPVPDAPSEKKPASGSDAKPGKPSGATSTLDLDW